ncbi:hotdog domain-containing protein [Aeromicrobium sp. CF4.19]|uniref:hotdog domain-containing protein n=1 Tax=Aeromicrobium sp. CF4.19 TaxID=3373082 RepID=UPI003EE4A2A5
MSQSDAVELGAMVPGEFDAREVDSYAAMVRALRGVQDVIASLGAVPAAFDALAEELVGLRTRLEPYAGPEHEQAWGRMVQVPARGRAMAPELQMIPAGEGRFEGTVRFGRWFLGAGGAAHGGAIALLFDDLLGGTATSVGAGLKRTLFLHVDYRALVPISAELQVEAWIESVDGRKIHTRGRICQEGVVCAEAKALFLELTPSQGWGRGASGDFVQGAASQHGSAQIDT